ncbi:MAG: prolyl oligopeptidase family serine peptidase [Holophagales bacterium]|nr:prolyl oligopeptidase family serine peptidase [Holophagales bacterium]MYD22638.1 prolyl oligopeptidase family serine peptidase [Holophagales bacterium]MYI31508.1 prolyl oligopeptidase family serine peptidase [Holophagales bacterium]
MLKIPRPRPLGPFVLLALLALQPAAAQKEPLELDHIYGPDALSFSPDLPRIRWLPGGEEYLLGEDADDGWSWTVVDAASGETRPFYDPEPLAAALAEQLDLSAEDAVSRARPGSLRMSPGADRLLLQLASDLFVWSFDDETLTRLTRGPEAEELARFAPNGRRVAFVRDADLYVVDASGNELRLTTDGGENTLNGKLDWVYQEEIYGRGNYQAHWWSPDSRRVAFLQTDERDVPRFTVVDHIPFRPPLEVYPYPKAGDPNPRVRLGVAKASGAGISWIDPDLYGHDEILIVNVTFSPDGHVWYQVQDRRQTFLDLHRADPATGESERVLREESHAWVNVLGPPRFLEDGSFLWLSERTGFQHLYRHDQDGKLVRTLTDGRWEVRSLLAVDEDAGAAYVSGTYRSTLGADVLRVPLEGAAPTVLTEATGSHRANFPEEGPVRHWIATSSDLHTPTTMTLRNAGGEPVRKLGGGDVPDLARFDISKPELLQISTSDGVDLEAMLIRPHGFDPDRVYPAWVHVYGGPHAQQVRNGWPGSRGMWFQYLAQQGIVVLVVDNRIASGKGVESTWPVYRNFGEQELIDLVEAVDWLGAKPWVDAGRIGLDGWSFGGYMTLFALTRSDRFRAGIAGGSVVDWRAYDSIYTERYMSTPDDNPDGYERTSVLETAGDLHGDLLIIHGTMDDNVHMQNTLQMAWKLQKAGKPFEMMLYPKSRHGVTDPDLSLHLRETMARFILKTIEP